MLRPFDVLEHRREAAEIRRVAGIDAVAGFAVIMGIAGIENEEGLLFLIPDGLRGPGTARTLRSQRHRPGLRPVYEVVGGPEHHVPAAALDGAAPVVIPPLDAQVRRHDIVRPGQGVADDEGVADALIALVPGEGGLVGQILPMQSILADGKENLLPAVVLAGEIGEQIGHGIPPALVPYPKDSPKGRTIPAPVRAPFDAVRPGMV